MPRAKKPTPASSPTARPYAFDGWEQESAVSWRDVDAGVLKSVVQAVTDRGDALVLGRSSDGGALQVTLLAGEHKVRKYLHLPEECERFLRDVTEWALDASINGSRP